MPRKMDEGGLTLINGSLLFSDPDVAHGITTNFTSTDIYASMAIFDGLQGGLQLDGVSDGDQTALLIRGVIGSADPTDTTPAIILRGAKKNSATIQALAAAETLLAIDNNATRLFVMYGNGSILMTSGSALSAETVRAIDASGLLLAKDDGTYMIWLTDNGDLVLRTTTTAGADVLLRSIDGIYLQDQGGTVNYLVVNSTGAKVRAGTGAGDAAIGGVMYSSTVTVGNIGTGVDQLMAYSIPLNTLINDGDSIWFEAIFRFTNAAGTKTVTVNFGATILTSVSTGGGSAVDVVMKGRIWRSGAATQRAWGEYNTSVGQPFAIYTTPAETLSGAVVIRGMGTGALNSDEVTQVSFVVGYDPVNT